MKQNAYAKINLTLEIIGKRQDGFHNIESVFQEISLCDEIEIEKNNTLDIKFVPSIDTKKSTVYKSAETFFKTTRIRERAKIKIKKNIPIKSGLGGGSSDAATTLLLLNKLFMHPMKNDEVINMGETIGSDVPFFFFGGTSLVEGKGERVYPISPIKKLYVLLLIPSFSFSTKNSYSQIDGFKFDKTNHTKKLISILEKEKYDLSEIENCLHNDFEKMHLHINKIFTSTLRNLEQKTSKKFHLTGSGSTLFALFDNLSKAQQAQIKLKTTGIKTILTETR
ncbi:MAG: 4-(cytidine 5'-diphospho)-2-C-methyl-D-erythritol kinase [Caldisericota bacterium]|nr:4-(cytidine 5'-diphospho)-2-C-methyl-D-erythritol kinase [Caldisericota bacterium]